MRCVIVSVVAATVLLPGCAAPPSDPVARAEFVKNNDPLEPLNREIFDLNRLLDAVLMRPVAKAYVALTPEEGRDALRRVINNLKEPTVFFNNVLQGEMERAGITLGRFAVNTTAGLGGLVDVATKWGLERQRGDFGQTLFVWGLPEGPYLILPILGPSNPRDAIGMGIDSYADPMSLISRFRGFEEVSIARFVADGVDQRVRVLDVLDGLEKNSLDFYAQLRSLSQQNRAAELRRGAAPATAPNFYDDPGKPQSPEPSSPPPAAANPPSATAKPAAPAAPPAPVVRSPRPPRPIPAAGRAPAGRPAAPSPAATPSDIAPPAAPVPAVAPVIEKAPSPAPAAPGAAPPPARPPFGPAMSLAPPDSSEARPDAQPVRRTAVR